MSEAKYGPAIKHTSALLPALESFDALNQHSSALSKLAAQASSVTKPLCFPAASLLSESLAGLGSGSKLPGFTESFGIDRHHGLFDDFASPHSALSGITSLAERTSALLPALESFDDLNQRASAFAEFAAQASSTIDCLGLTATSRLGDSLSLGLASRTPTIAESFGLDARGIFDDAAGTAALPGITSMTARTSALLPALESFDALNQHSSALSKLAAQASSMTQSLGMTATSHLAESLSLGLASSMPTIAEPRDIDAHQQLLHDIVGTAALPGITSMTARTSALLPALESFDALNQHSSALSKLAAQASSMTQRLGLTATSNLAESLSTGLTSRIPNITETFSLDAHQRLLDDIARTHSRLSNLTTDSDQPAEGRGPWVQTRGGLWVPTTADVVAMAVASIVLLWLIGAYLSELNRTGASLANENRVGLAADLAWMGGVAWFAHRLVLRFAPGNRDENRGHPE